MPDTFAITIAFIAVATAVAAFLRRVRRDKCLKDFAGYVVTFEPREGPWDQGRLHVENTGLVFTYADLREGPDQPPCRSRLLYKAEMASTP